MAKAKRMSDMFASSTEQPADTTMATATPPYSSEGPTLPTLESSLKQKAASPSAKGSRPAKTSNAPDQAASPKQTPSQPQHTVHPSLYKPWTLLPPDLLQLLSAQARLRPAQNVIPIVFTRNQNVKTGINRLKTYLGAYRDPKSTIGMPDALMQDDFFIAISAQGEGTIKLVSIVDLVRRVVATSDGGIEREVEKWYMYTVLTHVEVEPKAKSAGKAGNEDDEEGGVGGDVEAQDVDEEEAFEPMDVDGLEKRSGRAERSVSGVKKRKVPVLTVWMTRKSVAALKNAFGEQVFSVLPLAVKEA
ncbi:hypothetical protein IQ07DRAFT_590008 [Pyrenochaeta sp. DS3sAY3a]|nr:hypothetical protein IQ07DRAFT_590008 [Pyrenochaeta sp. DS3sAY3a]